MAAITGWQGGRLNSGLAWTACFAGADLNSLANGSSVLSSQGDITNGTSLDMFADVSLELAISSSTIAAGANLALWIFELNEDGSTYGDNSLTAGTAAAVTPGLLLAAVMPLRAAAAQTALYGYAQGIVIPPGTFRFAVQNNSGFTLSASGNAGKFRSYNINVSNTT